MKWVRSSESNLSTSRVLQIQQRPRSVPPSSVWPDQASLPWSSSPSSFMAGSPFNMSEYLQCGSQQSQTVINSTLLQTICNNPLSLQPLAQLLNCRQLKVHMMMQQVSQVLPSTLLPSWMWSPGHRRTQTHRRKWNRTVSFLS